jgi:hypothetical protein
MVNPTLIRKKETALTATDGAKKLFQVIYREQNKQEEKSDVPRIKVSSLISKMSFYYEKIRNSVDYKEDHLLRKNAVLRILKRQIVIEGKIYEIKTESVARHLLVELIRAGYLPNDKLPETKIREIGAVIEKYLLMKKFALEEFSRQIKHIPAQDAKKLAKYYQDKSALAGWIITMAACEIEERLGKSAVNLTVISNMYGILNKNVILPEESPFKKDGEIQIYIAIHRNLLKFDNDMIGFILLKYFNANWHEAAPEQIERVGRSTDILIKAIEEQINHPLAGQLNRIVSRHTVYSEILTDVIKENPVKVYDSFKTDPKAFPRDIKNICKKRYQAARGKLWRAAVRSIVYIFVTKSVFVFILEIPAIKFFGEPVNPVSLIINVVFPSLLLFLAVLLTGLPSEENTNRIIQGIEEIVFIEKENADPIRLRTPSRRRGFQNAVFGLIYAVTFFLSFGLVVYGLDFIGFNWVSITIFLFFLAFVSFFAIRIRRIARDLIVIESKEELLGLLADFFYTPVIAAGKWLSEKFARINVFVFILDFIIEAPFKIFVEIAEEWTKYVKERKEEIV